MPEALVINHTLDPVYRASAIGDLYVAAVKVVDTCSTAIKSLVKTLGNPIGNLVPSVQW